MLGRNVDLGNPVSDHPLNNGLVAWYLPLSNNSFGSRLFDLRGGTPVTLSGGPPPTSGPGAFPALDFNGSTQHGQAALNLSAWSIITVGLWARADAWAGAGSFNMLAELTADGAANAGGLALYQEGSITGLTAACRGNVGASSAAYSGTRPAVGTWAHLLAVFDFTKSTNEVDLYLNGSLLTPSSRPANSNNSGTFANSTFNLAARNGSSLRFDGRLTDVRVRGWTRSPTDADLWAEYDQARRDHPDTLRRWSRRAMLWVPAGGGTASGAGSAAVAFSPAATGAATARADAASALAFTPSGTGAALAAGSGATTLAFAVAGTASSLAAASGSVALSLAASGVGAAVATGSGSAALAFATSGAGAAVAAGAGASALTFAVAGAGAGAAAGTGVGSVALTLTASGTGAALASSAGASALTLTPSGSGAARATAAGASTLAFAVAGLSPSSALTHTVTGTWEVPSRAGTWAPRAALTGTWAAPSLAGRWELPA